MLENVTIVIKGDTKMDDKGLKFLFIGLVIGLFVFGFNSSGFAGSSITIQWGKDSDSSNQAEGYSQKKKGGPPAHAPAHGYRAKHQYRYYASRSVYYDTQRRLYFYLKGENWEIGATLPNSLRVGLGDFVSIELDTDKPYTHHQEHRKKYPPGKAHKKHKKLAKKK